MDGAGGEARIELAAVNGQSGQGGQGAGSLGHDAGGSGQLPDGTVHAHAAEAAESSAPVFRDGVTLARNTSLRPEDPPPEPFVYRNLEEIAEKLGALRAHAHACPSSHRA